MQLYRRKEKESTEWDGWDQMGGGSKWREEKKFPNLRGTYHEL